MRVKTALQVSDLTVSKFKYLFLKNGLKDQMVSDATGISKESISKMRRGNMTPTPKFVNYLCKKCKVKMDWLMDDEQPIPERPSTKLKFKGASGYTEKVLTNFEAWELILKGYVVYGYTEDLMRFNKLSYQSTLAEILNWAVYTKSFTHEKLKQPKDYVQPTYDEAEITPYLKNLYITERSLKPSEKENIKQS